MRVFSLVPHLFIIICASMRAAVVDAYGRVYHRLCQHACSGRRCASACVLSFLSANECRGRGCSWACVCVCKICACARAAVPGALGRVCFHLCQSACSGRGCAWECVLPCVPACVQRLWVHVAMCSTTCASIRAAVRDARGRAYFHLQQRGGLACARRSCMRTADLYARGRALGVCVVFCAGTRAAAVGACGCIIMYDMRACVQPSWTRVGMRIIMSSSACVFSLVPACVV